MKLSIITINYNNAAGLKNTLDSVASQICTDFEHIIVDGASTDDSIDVIRAYNQSHIANHYKITWLSEPDAGIYNAMNKGVGLAKGEYTLMLNSGDYLVDEYVIEKVLPLLDGTDIIQGNIIMFDNQNKIVNRSYGKSDISFVEVYMSHFLHQAAFIRKNILEEYGCYDENYKIGGDSVFFLKALGFGNATFKYLDINISFYERGGVSADYTPYWIEQRQKEDQMYDTLLPQRLLKLCKEDGYKIDVYNKLSSHWLFKKCLNLMLLMLKNE